MFTKVALTFFALVLPVLAIYMPVPDEVDGLAQRDANSFTGRGTTFSPGNGACGGTNSGSDLVVAISPSIFDNGAHCNHQVSITSGGQSVQATVVDKCGNCGAQDIDMSTAAFQQLTGQTGGAVDVTWSFL